tara:strand:- start:5117 stop:5698 length:582 start_codon:yes stop_codon:yes gene_type:complete
MTILGGRMMTEKLLMIVMTVMSFVILILGLVSFPMMASAGEMNARETEALNRLLTAKDRQLFDHSFGNCTIEVVDDLISTDFEFYHDKGGVTSSKAAFMRSLSEGFCRLEKEKSGYRNFRVLTQGSLKVFPLYDGDKGLYGAVQTGEHAFYESYDGGNPLFRSAAKFTHLWILEDDVWRIRRVLSYDHQSPEE